MIKTFKCNDTEKIFNDFDVKKIRSIAREARIKLEVLHATVSLKSLRVPPGNRLEQLKGESKGQYRGSCKSPLYVISTKGRNLLLRRNTEDFSLGSK